MNIASAELLQRSLENLGQTFQHGRAADVEAEYRKNQLALEQKRMDVDDAYRQEQLASNHRREATEATHFGVIEKNNAERNRLTAEQQAISNKLAEHTNKLHQTALDQAEATKTIDATTRGLQDETKRIADKVTSGEWSKEEGDLVFQMGFDDAFHGNEALKKQLMTVPQFSQVYSGQADWGEIGAKIQAEQDAANARQKEAAAQAKVGKMTVENTTKDENGNTRSVKFDRDVTAGDNFTMPPGEEKKYPTPDPKSLGDLQYALKRGDKTGQGLFVQKFGQANFDAASKGTTAEPPPAPEEAKPGALGAGELDDFLGNPSRLLPGRAPFNYNTLPKPDAPPPTPLPGQQVLKWPGLTQANTAPQSALPVGVQKVARIQELLAKRAGDGLTPDEMEELASLTVKGSTLPVQSPSTFTNPPAN